MFWFLDNWCGDTHEYRTLREAKKEARKCTYGHSVSIHHNGAIVAVIEAKENPLP